jgi:hypothetical protein
MGQSLYSVLVRTLMVNQFAQPFVEAPWLVTPLRVVLGGLVIVVLLNQITRRRSLPTVTLALEHGLVMASGLLIIPLAEDFHFTYLGAALTAGLIVALRSWRPREPGLPRGPFSSFWRRQPRPGLLLIAYVGYLGVLCLPALRLVSHAFYRYGDGPVGFPLSALMNFQALLLLLGVVLIAAALRADLLARPELLGRQHLVVHRRDCVVRETHVHGT